MKKILKTSILILLLVFLYQYRVSISEQLALFKNNISTFFAKAPCAEPIPYTLGTFDTKFNISKDYFLSALVDAEAVWEKPFGKDLFVYAPTDTETKVLKINLIYDYRQQATSKLEGLGIVVKNDRTSYDMLKAKFTVLKEEYSSETKAFNVLTTNFNQEKQAYETEVNYWNNKGGAPKTEYNKIEADRVKLEDDLKTLQNKQNSLNEMVDEINALVVVLNRLITTLNISVDQYNTVNTSRGESFEEGVYSSDGVTRQIDIYEFSNREKLVRVLAHELGHALDLNHVADPKAIMYEFNQGNNTVATPADLAELKTKCGVK